MESLEFYSNGRLKYNPNYHHCEHEPWTLADDTYLVKYIGYDGYVSMSYALGRTVHKIEYRLKQLKESGFKIHE